MLPRLRPAARQPRTPTRRPRPRRRCVTTRVTLVLPPAGDSQRPPPRPEGQTAQTAGRARGHRLQPRTQASAGPADPARGGGTFPLDVQDEAPGLQGLPAAGHDPPGGGHAGKRAGTRTGTRVPPPPRRGPAWRPALTCRWGPASPASCSRPTSTPSSATGETVHERVRLALGCGGRAGAELQNQDPRPDDAPHPRLPGVVPKDTWECPAPGPRPRPHRTEPRGSGHGGRLPVGTSRRRRPCRAPSKVGSAVGAPAPPAGLRSRPSGARSLAGPGKSGLSPGVAASRGGRQGAGPAVPWAVTLSGRHSGAGLSAAPLLRLPRQRNGGGPVLLLWPPALPRGDLPGTTKPFRNVFWGCSQGHRSTGGPRTAGCWAPCTQVPGRSSGLAFLTQTPARGERGARRLPPHTAPERG